jgi:hypothetical protein
MPPNHLQIHPLAAGYLSTAFMMACLPLSLIEWSRMRDFCRAYAVAARALALPTNHQPKSQQNEPREQPDFEFEARVVMASAKSCPQSKLSPAPMALTTNN